MSQPCDKTVFTNNMLAKPFTENTQSLLQQMQKPAECSMANSERKAGMLPSEADVLPDYC